MPMQRHLYPADWPAIALRVKRAAGWRCEFCDRPCFMPGENLLQFCDRVGWPLAKLVDSIRDDAGHLCPSKVFRFVLTAAHLNQIPADCRPANLKALCSVCHRRYDNPLPSVRRRLRLERNGQLNLFYDPLPVPSSHQQPLIFGPKSADRDRRAGAGLNLD